MRVDIAYVNGRGERLELGGDDASLHYFEHGLRDWSWSWSTGAAAGKVSSFSRRGDKPAEVPFPVGIGAGNAEEGIALRNRVQEVGEHDIAAKSPGRLYVGDWYLRCWIVAGEPTDYWMDDRIAELDLTLLVDDPGWVLEREMRFVPETGADGLAAGADFPCDLPAELKRERLSKTVSNGALFPCDFLWRAYGPATDPYVRVAGNLYKVNVDLPAGSRLEVDSAARSVTVVSQHGERSDAYGDREKGPEGSGSYIFEKVPVGESSLSWDNSFAFDLVLYDVRTACPWEEG